MCRALCRLVYSPDPVYAWPLVTMVAQSSLPNMFLCSFRAEARGQHGDVVGPGMSGLLGSARTLLQEYAVKGALLCTAGKKIHMESPPLANDHAWVESSVTYHQKHLSSIQNHHWWLTFLSKKRFTSGRHDPAFGFSASTSSTLLYFSVIWIRIINTEIQMTIQGSSSWAITIQKAVLP